MKYFVANLHNLVKSPTFVSIKTNRIGSASNSASTSKSAKVKTGDVNHGGIYAALGVLGAAILAAVLGMRKKGKFWQK